MRNTHFLLMLGIKITDQGHRPTKRLSINHKIIVDYATIVNMLPLPDTFLPHQQDSSTVTVGYSYKV